MSAFKLSLLLCSSLSFHLGLGRPPSPTAEDMVMVTTIRECIWRHIGLPAGLFLKAMVWLAAAGESMVIIGSLCDMPRSPGTFLDMLGPVDASRLTITFVLGSSLVIAGGIIRLMCFQTLGPYYTFIQCLRKEHRLITHGPYAVIHHPGYLGLLFCIIGLFIMHGSPTSWLQMSTVLGWLLVRVALGSSCLIMAACIVTVFCRSADEDRYLSKRFGREWESWAERVKYKLVPFIY